MKKAIFSRFAVLVSTFVFAQYRLFITPGAGIGFSSSSFKVLHPFGSVDEFVPSHQLQANIGYLKGRWMLETGIAYLTTGVTFVSPYDVPTCGLAPVQGGSPTPAPKSEPTSFNENNKHVTVPVMLSYVVYHKNKFSFIPSVGAALMISIKSNLTSTSIDFEESGYTSPFHENTVSGELVMSAGMAYTLCRNLSFMAGPSMQCMFSSLVTKIQGEAMSRVYNYSCLMNVRLRYRIK